MIAGPDTVKGGEDHGATRGSGEEKHLWDMNVGVELLGVDYLVAG